MALAAGLGTARPTSPWRSRRGHFLTIPPAAARPARSGKPGTTGQTPTSARRDTGNKRPHRDQESQRHIQAEAGEQPSDVAKLRIDTEDHELAVPQGATALRATPPPTVLELLPEVLQQNVEPLREIISANWGRCLDPVNLRPANVAELARDSARTDFPLLAPLSYDCCRSRA